MVSPQERAAAAYASVVAVRNAEVTTHWTRYNIQIVLNSTILFGFLATDTGQRLPAVVNLGTVLGSILSLIWLTLNARGHMWIRFWNQRLQRIEATSGLPSTFGDAVGRSGRGVHIAALGSAVPVLFSGAWFVLALLKNGVGWLALFTAVSFAVSGAAFLAWHVFFERDPQP